MNKESKHILNKDLKISIKELNNIVNNIYDRYPLISKQEIALIVRSFFENIRYILHSENIISINSFLPIAKLLIFTHKNSIGVKVKTATPKNIKNARL